MKRFATEFVAYFILSMIAFIAFACAVKAWNWAMQ